MSEFLTIDLKELETKVENGKGFNHKEATVLLEFVRKIISNGGTVQPIFGQKRPKNKNGKYSRWLVFMKVEE
ncbi:hypothetical protein [Lactococcus lactis]|uniref:Uncharacterized protein n=1 Tax=Lactococcus lactis TaxID=1358 RepID=A0AAP4DTZ6_9LACT|nr:hypothetical protein [Lactococcus lactis]MDG4976099.1 hypothetical protein [Lactococcus lactis]